MTKKNRKEKLNNVDLKNIGVIITRPKELSEKLINLISQTNGMPFAIPCLSIVDVDDTSNAMDICQNSAKEYDYWVFTSPNAVEFAHKLGLDFTIDMPLISLGAGTTQALKKLTKSEVIQANKPYTTEALLKKLASYDLTDKKIAIFSGEGGRRLLKDSLNEAGAIASYIDVYKRIKPDYIDIKNAVDYSHTHTLIVLISSQEAFQNLHDTFIEQQIDAQKYILIVASQRLADFVHTLGYNNVEIANSAVSHDLWQKLIDSVSKENSMTQTNTPEVSPDNNKIDTAEIVQTQPQTKPNMTVSYIAIALGLIGIGIGGISFIDSSENGVDALSLQTTIQQQKATIDSLSQNITQLQKAIKANKTETQEVDLSGLTQVQETQKNELLQFQESLSAFNSALSNLQADSGSSLNRYNQLKDYITEFEKMVTKLDQSITEIGKVSIDTQNEITKTQNRLTMQMVEVNSKLNSLTALEERLEASSDVDLLHLSQARYLLQLANFKLMFEGDSTMVIKILNEASNSLMTVANTKFSETNNLIKSKIVELEDIKVINDGEYAARLQRMIDAVPSLKTRSDDFISNLKSNFQVEATNEQENASQNVAWYKRAFEQIKPIFIVTEKRTEVPALISITDEILIKQNVQTQLMTARLALLQHQTDIYQDSLKAAKILLSTQFSQEDEVTHQMLQAINELLDVDINRAELDIIPIIKSFNASMLNYGGEGL